MLALAFVFIPFGPGGRELTVGGPTIGGPRMPFVDGFEEGIGSWVFYEEIVNGNPCYGTDIGRIYTDPAAARDGNRGLVVFANSDGTLQSNHPFAARRLDWVPRSGVLVYSLDAKIPVTYANTTQTGPEFSMQDTKADTPGMYLTGAAGFQYVPSPWVDHDWNLWITDPTNGTGTWGALSPQGAWVPIHHAALTPGEWYHFELAVDFRTDRYVRLLVDGPGVHDDRDLSEFGFPRLAKGFVESGFWISLEATNLWNNCGANGVFMSQLHYDNAALFLVG